MAELIAGAALGVLAQKLMDGLLLVYACQVECEKLGNTLKSIKPILTEIHNIGNPNLDEWLSSLKSLFEGADALVEKCKKRRLALGRLFAKFKYGSKILKFVQDIDDRMKYITLAHMAREDARTSKGLVPQVVAKSFQFQIVPEDILGMDDHFEYLKKSIIEGLSKEGPSYIGITGQGGRGKTLLAQRLHNDEEIQGENGKDSILWITLGRDASISGKYTMMRKFLGIREEDAAREDLNDQRTHLVNEFSKRKVLLILDDVWSITFESKQVIEWLDVARGIGSVTLVTTREPEVFSWVEAEVVEEEMPLLSPEDSWKLFCIHAFPKDSTLRLELEIVALAEKVCNECKCLPLALKVVGSAMRGKSEIEEWRSALRHLRDSRPILGGQIEELYARLRLSYDGLADEKCRSVLQKCFLYLAAFPEDFEIPAETLCKLWISEDIFEDGIGVEGARDEARSALKVLSIRSLVEFDRVTNLVKMHDVLRDLAIYLFRRINIDQLDCTQEPLFKPLMDRKHFRGESCLINLKVKRMSLVFNYEREYLNNRNAPDHMRKCLLELDLKARIPQIETMEVGFFSSMRNLRYLQMIQMTSLEKLPESITGLKHLLFLDLSSCEALKELPQGIGGLTSLRHLNLGSCKALEELPQGIGGLTSLRHLNLGSCKALEELPETFGGLKSLEHVHLFECGALKELPQGIGGLTSLKILDLQGCKALEELPKTIGNLQSLENLNLQGCRALMNLPEAIGNLQSLENLNLQGCRALMNLPEAIGNLQSLENLNLQGCRALMKLPKAIGNLQSLENLNL